MTAPIPGRDRARRSAWGGRSRGYTLVSAAVAAEATEPINELSAEAYFAAHGRAASES